MFEQNYQEFARNLLNDKICRLCLCYTDVQPKLDPVFLAEVDFIYGVNLMNDNYPKRVCIICESKIDCYKEFRHKCRESDGIIKKLYLLCDCLKYVGTEHTNIKLEAYSKEIEDIIKTKVETKQHFEIQLKVEYANQSDNESVKSFAQDESLDRSELKSESSDEQTLAKKVRKLRTRRKKRVPINKEALNDTSSVERKSFVRKDSNLITINSVARPKIEGLELEDTEELLELKRKDWAAYEIEKRKRKCPVCMKVYTNNYCMNVHYSRVHLNEKLFMCDTCGKSFNEPNRLQKHMDIHSLKRPHKCSECEETFRLWSELRRHMYKHNTSGRPYSCEICGLTFRHRSHKCQHMSLHNNPYPYTCSVCSKKFKKRWSYKNHYELKHKGNHRYECDICHMRFGYDTSLRYHWKKAHGVTSKQEALEKALMEPKTKLTNEDLDSD